jgi:predicted nucleotidyltransferase
MFESSPSPSSDMTFAEVIDRLKASDAVRGIALFGSVAANPQHVASDYDLLVLVNEADVHIFQMHTWIDHISADIVFVETDLVERVINLQTPISGTSAEGLVISWMEYATILNEAEDKMLTHVQSKIREREWRIFETTPSSAYEDWFWLNFDLRHIQRLAHSNDQFHLMTADIRLMACFSGLSRAYFRLRGLLWKGEKAALRDLYEHDNEYFAMIERYLQATSREAKIELCERLIERTLEPVGKLWLPESTALYLKQPSNHPDDVDKATYFWESLLK